MRKRLEATWLSAKATFDARAPRERALALVVAVATAIVAGDTFFLHPAQARIRSLQLREESLARPAGADAIARANAALDQRRRQLTAQLKQVDTALVDMRRDMVAPGDMKRMLDELIVGLPGLRLVHLRNLAPEVVQNGPGDAPVADGQIYRHGFEVTLEGSYADLTQYMTRLESSKRHILWKRAELDASGYPAVQLVLTLYTLSQDATWLVL